MAKFRIKNGSVRKIEASLKTRTAKMQRQAAFGLASWSDDTVTEMKNEVRRIGAFDTGQLHASIQRSAPQLVGKKIRIRIFSPLEYASIIEFGRKAGKAPPLLALVGWARRKGLVKRLPVSPSLDGRLGKKLAAARAIFNRKRSGGKSRKQRKPLDQEIRDFLVVLGIQRAIQKRGIKGKRPLTRIFDKRAKNLKKVILSYIR